MAASCANVSSVGSTAEELEDEVVPACVVVVLGFGTAKGGLVQRLLDVAARGKFMLCVGSAPRSVFRGDVIPTLLSTSRWNADGRGTPQLCTGCCISAAADTIGCGDLRGTSNEGGQEAMVVTPEAVAGAEAAGGVMGRRRSTGGCTGRSDRGGGGRGGTCTTTGGGGSGSSGKLPKGPN